MVDDEDHRIISSKTLILMQLMRRDRNSPEYIKPFARTRQLVSHQLRSGTLLSCYSAQINQLENCLLVSLNSVIVQNSEYSERT